MPLTTSSAKLNTWTILDPGGDIHHIEAESDQFDIVKEAAEMSQATTMLKNYQEQDQSRTENIKNLETGD